jgi:hypothetical protein
MAFLAPVIAWGIAAMAPAAAGAAGAAILGEGAMFVGASGLASVGAASMAAPIAAGIGTVGTIASLAGTGVQAYGQYQAGQDQASAQDYNAEVDRNEALAAKDKATQDEILSRERSRRIIGMQRAAYGKAGVDISTGTPLDVMAQAAADAELDALNIRYAGEMLSNKYLNQASQLDWLAPKTATAGILNAGGTILSGAGRYINTKRRTYSGDEYGA